MVQGQVIICSVLVNDMYGTNRVAQVPLLKGLPGRPLAWLLIGGIESQFDNVIDASNHSAVIHICTRGCAFVKKSCVLRLLKSNACQQHVPVGGRDVISSRAEMQHGFPTSEVGLEDMHVSDVSSLTRSCKVGRLATLPTPWWWCSCRHAISP